MIFSAQSRDEFPCVDVMIDVGITYDVQEQGNYCCQKHKAIQGGYLWVLTFCACPDTVVYCKYCLYVLDICSIEVCIKVMLV